MRRTNSRRLLGAVAMTVAACSLGSAATGAAAVTATGSGGPHMQHFGVRLVDVPVDEAHNPRGLRYIIDFLHPGMVIHRRILVENEESRRGRFTVYPDAARIRHGFFLGDGGHTRSELTTWVKVAHPKLRLGPHKSRMDMITIRVPKKATRGEHYGVIWTQEVIRARANSGFMVREVVRAGIRIYLAVGRGGVPPTRFVITSIAGHRTARGRLLLAARVHDTGGRAVDLSGTVRLTGGPGGISTGSFASQQVLTLAPGQSGNVTFLFSRRLPAGPWQARVKLVSGLTVARASATVLFYGHLSTLSWLRTTAWVAAALLAALLVVMLIRRMRRLRQPEAGHPSEA